MNISPLEKTGKVIFWGAHQSLDYNLAGLFSNITKDYKVCYTKYK